MNTINQQRTIHGERLTQCFLNKKEYFYKDPRRIGLAKDDTEKDLLAVVKVEDLMRAIKDSDENSGVQVRAHIVDPKTGVVFSLSEETEMIKAR